MSKFDAEKTYQNLVEGMRRFFRREKISRAVVGVSGGVDSALAMCITADALGAKNVQALFLPYKGITHAQDRKDAFNVCKQAGVACTEVPINETADAALKTPWKPSRDARKNTLARARMIKLYSYANTHNAVVVGTGNKSEILAGYFTKHGDGAVDVLPLAHVYKTQVYELAKYRGIPNAVIGKKPSARLERGQTDEKEMGLTYGEMDEILRERHDKGETLQALKKRFQPSKVVRAHELHKTSRHKRRTPHMVRP